MKIHVTDRDGAEHVVEGQDGDALMIPLQGADLVDLNEKPIKRFTENGIIVGDEEIELDIIIFATGFDVMTGAMDRIDIRGRDALALKSRWKEGLTSYLGLMTRGFPNFFWINGPHSQLYNPILLS